MLQFYIMIYISIDWSYCSSLREIKLLKIVFLNRNILKTPVESLNIIKLDILIHMIEYEKCS